MMSRRELAKQRARQGVVDEIARQAKENDLDVIACPWIK